MNRDLISTLSAFLRAHSQGLIARFIPPDLSPQEESEYLHVLVICFPVIGICFFYLFLYSLWDHPVRLYGYISNAIVMLGMFTSLFLLQRRHIVLAVFTVVLGSYLAISISAYAFGRGMSFHHLMPIAAGGILLLHPREKSWLATFYGLLGLAIYILLEMRIPLMPLIGPPITPEVSFFSTMLSLSFTYLSIMGYVAWSSQVQEKLRLQVETESKRSEELLLNILPPSVARRLLHSRSQIADGFESVTVLFADIVNFSELSQDLPPPELVAYLNEIFSRFDQLTQDHGLEKIKTIGDAYMVAGGIPEVRADHAEAVVRLAISFLSCIDETIGPNERPLQIRIGIHTGPVIAGVIGLKKFIYDLWGDTVNLASRLESSGLVNTIQISETTYSLVKDSFEFEERGVLDLKGHGLTRTWIYRDPSKRILSIRSAS